MKGDKGHGNASWGTKPIALSAKSAMVLISWGIPLVMFLRLKLSFHAWTNNGIGWFRKHIHIGDRNSLNDTKGWYSFFFWGGVTLSFLSSGCICATRLRKMQALVKVAEPGTQKLIGFFQHLSSQFMRIECNTQTAGCLIC